ncbi:MAG: Single-stranded DNA-binding protein ssb [Candidatus Izimaplasma bacterium HR2]|nr:MAG: Single-stranded DNA-binding protein ssb [Candidatus Izimaplasma bacterium HR2]
MINRVVLVGRLTKDPELRYTSSNIPVSKFTLAVNRTFAGPSGEREADFIQCVVWRKQAENLAKFVRKGSLIGVEGRIQTGSYDDKDGIRKYTTEVIGDSVQFLEPKSQQQDNSGYNDNYRQDYQQNNNYQKNNNNTKKESTPTIDVAEDDLPF